MPMHTDELVESIVHLCMMRSRVERTNTDAHWCTPMNWWNQS